MKKTTRTMTEDVWECETCGHQHNNDYGGKWDIFHCPEHGEFCNDGLKNCGLYRTVNEKGKKACCPICGWATLEVWNKEYDERKGELPESVLDKMSLKREQNYLFENAFNFSGSPSYKRLKAWTEKQNIKRGEKLWD